MNFHSQSSGFCSPFLVDREERGVAGVLVEGLRLQPVNRLAVLKETHSLGPVVRACSVFMSSMDVFVIYVPIGIHRVINVWRAK